MISPCEISSNEFDISMNWRGEEPWNNGVYALLLLLRALMLCSKECDHESVCTLCTVRCM